MYGGRGGCDYSAHGRLCASLRSWAVASPPRPPEEVVAAHKLRPRPAPMFTDVLSWRCRPVVSGPFPGGSSGCELRRCLSEHPEERSDDHCRCQSLISRDYSLSRLQSVTVLFFNDAPYESSVLSRRVPHASLTRLSSYADWSD